MSNPGEKSGNATKTPGIIKILAVVAILALLAGLSIPTITVGHGDRISESVALCYSIKSACESYVMEYNVLPASSENKDLVTILLGENPRKEMGWNPRGIAFLTVPSRHLSPQKEVIDQWGTPYRVFFDPKDFSITVLSAGKDLFFDTKDDISAPRKK